MTDRIGPALTSYLKTAVASAAVAALALLAACLAYALLPTGIGTLAAALLAASALAPAAVVLASLLVITRYRLFTREAEDLFLRLNRSREPDALAARAAVRSARLRRWFSRRTLGHDLLVGDPVRVRSWPEIAATLDESGCLDGLPFMPEMLPLCGRQAVVFRCMHRLFDYRKSRRMRHMDGAVLLVGAVCDGSSHGGCEAACHTIWKTAWLERVADPASGRGEAAREGIASQQAGYAALPQGTQGPRFVCQLTQLHDASMPLGGQRLARFLAPVISGNVAPAAFCAGCLTHLFNELQQRRHGIGFPAFDTVKPAPADCDEPRLKPGDAVRVKSAAQIRATLNDRKMHRGLWLEPDMLKHCGGRYPVQAEMRHIIDIVTGEMLTMKTPAYTLRGVHFSGERQQFNAQYEPLYWRAVWLRPDAQDGTSSRTSPTESE